MACWSLNAKTPDATELYYRDAVTKDLPGDDCVQRCVSRPLNFRELFDWVLSPGQAMFCDMLKVNGDEFFVMAADQT